MYISIEETQKLHVYNMNDLKDVQVAVFDFDATLAIQKTRSESDCSNLRWNGDAFKNPNFYLENFIAPKYMREFVSTLREMNSDIKFYCLTQMNYSFGLRAKEKFVHEYYGEDFKVISCGVKELKTESLNIIQYVEDIENKSEILLVDDIWETVDKTIDCGYRAMLPQFIYARFYEK